MKDYVEKLDSVASNKMIIKNRESVNAKLEKLIQGGYNKLQVLSDFDGTITKQHVNNKTQMHGYLVLYGLPSFPPEIGKRAEEITRNSWKYLNGPNLTQTEKFTRMLSKIITFLRLSNSTTIDSKMRILKTRSSLTQNMFYKFSFSGYVISKEELDRHCMALGLQMRDNIKEFFDILEEEYIPILLVSAGIGDVINSMIRNEGITGSNIEVASNFLNIDHEGRLKGLKASPIHRLNKIDCIKDTKFYNMLKGRNNVIVIGDQLGDAVMVEKLNDVNTVLKIGFFYGEPESVLPKWLDTFDIVLKDDQTMNIPNVILKLLENK